MNRRSLLQLLLSAPAAAAVLLGYKTGKTLKAPESEAGIDPDRLVHYEVEWDFQPPKNHYIGSFKRVQPPENR